MSFVNGGSFPASIVPAQQRMTLQDNYLAFDSAAGGGTFAQQYLPELYEAEVERYGNRTIGGFLRMVGAEMPMTSDQVIWSEQNRLHVAYKTSTVANVNNDASHNAVLTPNLTNTGGTRHAIRVGQTVLMSDEATGLIVAKGFTATGLKVFVYGSAYSKGRSTAGTGADSVRISVEPAFTQYNNSPVIIRDQYIVNGSDMAQIGWVEVATEDGASGYLWYLKAESETRLRFEDYLEMAMVEAEKKAGTSTVPVDGSEGLFSAINSRGHVMDGFAGAAGGK